MKMENKSHAAIAKLRPSTTIWMEEATFHNIHNRLGKTSKLFKACVLRPHFNTRKLREMRQNPEV
jgi:hypothetical protein